MVDVAPVAQTLVLLVTGATMMDIVVMQEVTRGMTRVPTMPQINVRLMRIHLYM